MEPVVVYFGKASHVLYAHLALGRSACCNLLCHPKCLSLNTRGITCVLSVVPPRLSVTCREIETVSLFSLLLCLQWCTVKPVKYFLNESVQFSSVAQLCLTLCDAMDCSGPVHHQL